VGCAAGQGAGLAARTGAWAGRSTPGCTGKMTPAWRAVLQACSLALVARAQLRILAPDSLAGQFPDTHGIIYGTTATFGAPYYGERVMGRLLYGESQGQDHCTAEDYAIEAPKVTPEDPFGPHGFSEKKLVNVVLVRRGSCTFVTKVRIAQHKEAHAVIVVDKASSTLTAEEIQHVMMGDDGKGYSVKIPSILISRFEGQKLIDAVKQGPVIVELAWDIPRSMVVVADFWMSSGSRESSEFLQRFKDCAETLKHHLQFVPHYHVFRLPPSASAAYGKLCTDESSQYCAPDPDGPGPITGADVVEEDLRQLCIWNVTARTSPDIVGAATYSQEFWDYVVLLADRCPMKDDRPSRRFSEKCSHKVMEEVGIARDKVDACIQSSRKKLLDEQIKNTAWSPQALRVNGWRYSGPLDPEAVLKAVCSGYAAPLQECDDLLNGGSLLGTISAPGLGLGIFAWTSLGMALCLVLLFYLYRSHVTSSVRKVLREEVMLEVQTQMADYAQLTDGPDRQGNRPSLSF